jgi:predicted nucleotidyltransferase
LIERLEASGVRYVVIGGLAMVARGAAHVTEDIDLVYARDAANLEAIVAALRDCEPRLRGAPPDLPFRWDARTLKGGLNFTLTTVLGDIDLLGDAAGMGSFDALWQSAAELDLYGFTVRVASLDALITMKRAAGRGKDQRHIMELERLRQLVADDGRYNPEDGHGC